MSLAPILAVAAPLLQIQHLAARPADSVELAARPVGRVEPQRNSQGWRYQWPGTYFEARFIGTTAYVDLGTGPTHARVSVDDVELADLIRPAKPVLRIDGLSPGEHLVRVDFVNENQDGIRTFGGFGIPAGVKPLAAEPRPRAIEFIGDSHTVGYGSASTSRTCTAEEVWRTTDNSLAFGPQVARHFGADYRVMAISGRGMVRNYANSPGDTLPQAYAHLLPALPGTMAPSADAGWSPQVIVIGLGTNDFSTPVAAGEPWPDAAGLSAAFEARYVDFVRSLKRRHPAARFVLVTTDAGHGAAERAVARVQSKLKAEGVDAVVLLVGPLKLDACDWHPSRSDQESVAAKVIGAIKQIAPAW